MTDAARSHAIVPVALASCLMTFLGFVVPTLTPFGGRLLRGLSMWSAVGLAMALGLLAASATALALRVDARRDGLRLLGYAVLASILTLGALFAIGWVLFSGVGTHCGPAINGTATCTTGD